MTGDNSTVLSGIPFISQPDEFLSRIPSLAVSSFQLPVLRKRLIQYLHRHRMLPDDLQRIPPAETGELAIWLYAGETQLFRDILFWQQLLVKPEMAFPEESGHILFLDCPTGEEYYSWEILRRHFFASRHIRIRITTQLSYCATLLERQQLVFKKIAGLNSTLQHLGRDIQVMKYLENKYNQWYLTLVPEQNREIQICDCITPCPSHSFSTIFCRNRLIYYKEDVCRIILSNLFRAAAPGGYFMAGTHDSREMITEAGFVPADREAGIYKKPLS
jgi:chemotaxis methyl-accepting protein methylase